MIILIDRNCNDSANVDDQSCVEREDELGS